ncbi:MAG: hypothetical protein AB7U61_08785 [Methylocystis sp.]
MTYRMNILGALLSGFAISAPTSLDAHDEARKSELFSPRVAHADRAQSADTTDPSWYEGFGEFGMTIRTRSSAAQKHFDQGLGLLWGFNHAAAVAAFRAAQEADPQCSTCYWAEAYAYGPNLNDVMRPENEEAARIAAKRAAGYARTAREIEMGQALLLRYTPDLPDQTARNQAFANAISKVADRFPTDANLQVIKADALMNLQPWDYWEAGGVTPKGNGAEILATLERAIELSPKHPAALHLYIHAVEASANPARAEKAADKLRGLVPAAGHLTHMPAHIYNRIGRYADSIAVNRDAIAADERYLALAGERASSLYRFGYYPHNVHFLLIGAQSAGLKELALEAADKLATITSDEVSAELAWVQAIRTAPYSAHAQFSDPETILALPAPDAAFPFVKGFWHYARGAALASKGALAEAQGEVRQIEKIISKANFASLEAQYLPARDVLGLAKHLIEGRIAAARGDFDAARRHVGDAIALEAKIPYMEPAYWPTPCYRTLGAIELMAGRPFAAAQAFEAALSRAPRDGGAAWGLWQARLAEFGPNPNREEAAALARLRAEFRKAWLGAESQLSLDRL